MSKIRRFSNYLLFKTFCAIIFTKEEKVSIQNMPLLSVFRQKICGNLTEVFIFEIGLNIK